MINLCDYLSSPELNRVRNAAKMVEVPYELKKVVRRKVFGETGKYKNTFMSMENFEELIKRQEQRYEKNNNFATLVLIKDLKILKEKLRNIKKMG